MREDIFERLHYQSGLVAQGCWDELDDYDREAIRRFGDLIVKECAMFSMVITDDHYDVDALYKHFGVEP
jgi:hypothetical protein